MDKVTYFKNFSMGTEIEIAGTFIYNGIKEFSRLRDFNNEEEIFHVLYPISVGIERLQKVLLVLLEDIYISEIEEFENSLRTHSHQDLHNRIISKCNMNFNSQQNSFLQLITNFYNTCRYSRFNLNGDYSGERSLIINFISTNLGLDIIIDEMFTTTPNDERIKNFFGRVVGSISRKYYEEIREQAFKLKIFTYELRGDSSAAKIFLPRFKRDSIHEQIVNEQISLKEFIVFLVNTEETSGFYDFIKTIEPLNIDIALAQEYLVDIFRGVVPQGLIDEVEYLYQEDIDNIKERLEMMEALSNERIDFDYDFDDNIEEE